MKKVTIVLIVILSNFILFSCASDDGSNQPVNPIEINKLVKSEKVSENLKVEYVYNDKDFLSSVTGTYSNFGYTSNYIYDSNDELTEWNYQETGSSTYSDTQNFIYDSQGRLTNYVANTENVTLAYNGDIVTLTGTIEGSSNSEAKIELNKAGFIIKFTESNQYTNFEYDLNGNMITAKSYDHNDNLIIEFTIGYDNKINPFYGQFNSIYIERFIEFFWKFNGIHVNGFEGYSFPFFKNNIISITENAAVITAYAYTYDNEDFPMNVNETSSGNSFVFDIEYY